MNDRKYILLFDFRQQAGEKVSTANGLTVRVVVEAHEPSHKGLEALV